VRARRASASSTPASAALQRVRHVFAGESASNQIVVARGEDQGKRRRAVAEIDSRRLAGRVELAGAVEYVVGDLKGDAEREAECADLRAPAAEPARGLEELACLQARPPQVVVHASVGPERLPPLERLAAGEGESGVGQDLDLGNGARRRELRERPGEQVVAGGRGDPAPVRHPDRGLASSQVGAIEHVVVDQRGHVDKLDGGAGAHTRVGGATRRARAQVGQYGPQTLPTRPEALGGDLGEHSRMRRDRLRESLLEPVEVAFEVRI
jgi:hypothetical protein